MITTAKQYCLSLPFISRFTLVSAISVPGDIITNDCVSLFRHRLLKLPSRALQMDQAT